MHSYPFCFVPSGLGGYLPTHVLTNQDLSKNLDTSDQWIKERTGIAQRHIAKGHESTSFMAGQAGQMALNQAGINASELDIIICATSTPDHVFPPTALKIQDILGAKNAVAFDMNVACSGFLFAWVMMDAYLKTSQGRHGLIIGAETMSRLLDWEDRSTAVLFGDGAGAMVLSRTLEENRGLRASHLFSDGSHYDVLGVSNQDSDSRNVGYIHMNGQAVFRRAVTDLEHSARTLLAQTGTSLDDIDLVIPHQANKRILDALCTRLKIPMEKMLFTGDTHANTSAASIPLALWKAQSLGWVPDQALILFQAFGAGFTGGSCLVRL